MTKKLPYQILAKVLIEEQYKIINMIHCWEKERDTLHKLQENHQMMMDVIASNILQENKP